MFQGFIELFAPGGWKAKLHSHKYIRTSTFAQVHEYY